MKYLSKCPNCKLDRYVAHKDRIGQNCRSCSKIIGRRRWSLINTKVELKNFVWERRLKIYKNSKVAEVFTSTECLGCHKEITYIPSSVLKNINRFGKFTPHCLKCNSKFYKGKMNASYKGGRWKDSDGYIQVGVNKDSPYWSMARGIESNINGHTLYVPEHRLVVAKSIGRLLSNLELVHHKDHNKSNNDISNLELVNAHTHRAITHAEMRVDQLEKEVERLKKVILDLQNKTSGQTLA